MTLILFIIFVSFFSHRLMMMMIIIQILKPADKKPKFGAYASGSNQAPPRKQKGNKKAGQS